MFLNVREVLAALQAKKITPAEARQAIESLRNAAPPVAAPLDLRGELAASLAEALYVDVRDLDVSRPFSELGLDSIIGVEWVRALSKRYGLNIPATKLYEYATVESLAAYVANEAPPASAERQLTASAGVHAASGSLETELASTLAEALFTDVASIDVDRPFSELGLDSIIGVEWVRALNQKFGLNISATRLYEHATVRALAAHIAGETETAGGEVDVAHVDVTDVAMPAPGQAAPREDGIAIIGMAGAFPKARNLVEFWDNLAAGRDCISEVPEDRWSVPRHFDDDPDAPGKSYSKWMGLLQDADRFDPLFFNIAPAEAEWIDPQQRVFLKAAWECIEDAGIDATTLSSSRCGVFVGCAPGDYGASFGEAGKTPEALMGLSLSILSARIAYFLNLKGPCLAIETSCSSSLVAIAQACDSLMLGQSDVALAGGVCVIVGPRMHVMTSKAGMLSKHGRCFTFDDRADGFVPGEGAGVVMLKRLSDALRDGDRIAGVIRGWGVNQDGRTNGITAPSAQAQAALEKDVYARFDIDPATIQLVETHGTATKLGDPIELEALTNAFRAFTDRDDFCALGSVKSNIGHLLSAAGVAGVIKVLLGMQHRTLPPTINFERLNPHISLEKSPFYVGTEARPWQTANGAPRRAAVSAFGFSGTNAHLVLEEAPAVSCAKPAARQQTIVLSARNEERLREQAAQLLRALPRFDDGDLPSIAYTLQTGRQRMQARMAMTASSLKEIAEKLQRYVDGRDVELVDAEVAVEWKEKPARVSLPTYPFARERYWRMPEEPVVAEANGELMTFEEVLEERALRGDSRARTIVCLAAVEQRPALRNAFRQDTQVVFIDDESELRDLHSVDGVLYVADGEGVAGAAAILRLVQAIARVQCPRLWLAGAFENALQRCHVESWLGFERSLKLGLPQTRVAVIALEKRDGWRAFLAQEVESESFESSVHADGRRSVWSVRPRAPGHVEPVLRDGGTYLITGGNGELGWLFARHLSQRYGAKVILTGRSPQQPRIATLDNAVYVQADVCDVPHMREIATQFGPIHGVIHAAGVVDVRSFLEKDEATFARTLAPKIAGTLALDEVFGAEPLDFIAYFSSTAAVLGDVGWCDYSVANRFQLAYARHTPRRIAIAWPLWQDGGMDFDSDDARAMYLRTSGQQPLDTPRGLAAFERLLGQAVPAPLVLVGDSERVHRFLSAPSASTGRRNEMKGWALEQCVLWDVREQASELLKVAREKLGADANLADFGFDSIRLATFAKTLGRHFGVELTPSVLFSHPTLGKLASYLLTDRRPQLESLYGQEHGADPIEARPDRIAVASSPPNDEAIAIIGMSGRFPAARSVDELWRILAEGRDVVDEIPADRFDWREHYPNETNSKWIGAIPGVAEFDPLFFELSPLEAETMDPRQRLLMQEAWNALEDAGYGAMHVRSQRIGMFVGVEQGDYQSLVGASGGVSSNHDAILAARLSYFLNLRGPAMAINTACSSGLVAAHQACLSLRAGECDTAIAAGVNVLVTPAGYIAMTRAGMLSPDGKCHAFDERANGMVPGEAVVAVVLKRLSQAEADGDPIHAVIRGSGINYDGKTNGITAPSGASQTSLLREVHARANVNPRELAYIVTHGTGTQLGDPIEINALYDAVKGSTSDAGFCALTSTKSNLGHTFAASGLVSLVSLVQAMRHETIPASLHCENENDYIVWASSPFFVNKSNRAWPRGGKPRLGAVSAFGMSGTNAHMVVEDYAERDSVLPSTSPVLLTLSAKSEQALEERVQQLLTVLRDRDWSAHELQSMSHTLTHGRQHFEHRLAAVASDRDHAIHLLEHGHERIPNVYSGHIARDFQRQAAIARYAEELIASMPAEPARYRESLAALADLYCQGYELPWEKLFGGAKPRRIALPTYPFAKERYWVSARTAGRASVLHPLLHENTSDLSGQRFTSTFTGSEHFLAGHIVKGSRVLPGAAYLEMARAAVALATSAHSIRLENVAFARPLVVDEPRTIHVALTAGGDGIAYEIYGEDTHSQGVARATDDAQRATLDLDALRAQCTESMTPARCYATFASMGLDYGVAHRGLQNVSIGPGFVLADVTLPRAEGALDPCVVDAALQGCVALFTAHGKPFLPFAIDTIDIFGVCPATVVSVLRETPTGSDTFRKVDADICDADGNVCVRLRGFSVRLLDAPVEQRIVEMKPVTEALEERTIQYLRKVVARTLKLDVQRVDVTAPFEKYGIDSILVMQLTGELEKSFGSLAKTLFFEYQSVRALAGYFLGRHRERLTEMLGGNEPAPMVVREETAGRVPAQRPAGGRRSAAQQRWQDIAIIGVSGRYPQAGDLDAFWENLKSGRDCITEIPKDRWDHDLYFDPEKGKPGKSFSKWGGFLDDVDRFDPLFFNISPREAEMMDPQERLFLECVHATLEDAGYTRESLSRDAGVFVGVMYEEYQLFGAQAQTLGRPLALFGSPSSIANRISFFCNFHGPSMAVDTMCSSSLTAIHLACHSLQRGDCEVAIAGGVNVSIHPNKYLTLSQGQFASSKGRCESFGEGGDGYVPGEGVGAVLLKPLARAIADGDRIYAVIKGSAVNHGGKTNGYSVPNPNAQAKVISQALAESGVSARAISYIEAHGTGTSLGDPIEIAGLTKAFGVSTSDRQFCAIGSVKSNIGHCESAAGIAGVTKVLLQLQHGTLVPSLHSEILNPHIDFASTPFVVQQELGEWTRPSIDGRECPRVAGISSFGAGGSNAHVVLEEFVAPAAAPVAITRQRPAIIVLSARTEAQLAAQTKNLLRAIESDRFDDSDLASIAYTLQIGREALEHRLALTVLTLGELGNQLRRVIAGDTDVDDVHRGTIRRNEDALSVFIADEDMQQGIEAWIAKGKYGKLLELWVRGLSFDWNRLHRDAQPRRISLPTYPFARDRYWAPLPELLTSGTAASASLHPLVQRNTSDFSEQRFTSTFSGSEAHLADHAVLGVPTLSAAAQIEMMRAAVTMAVADQDAHVCLENLAFVRPVAVRETVTLHVALHPEETGEIACEIYSDATHFQGSARIVERESLPLLDIASLQRACTRTLTAAECYATFRTLGMHYGPSHRALQHVQAGDGVVVAKYALPVEPHGALVLHPSIVDAALQASIGLVREPGTASIPFAVDRIDIHGACTPEGFAVLRGDAQKVDIDITDAAGRICVRIAGLSLRSVATAREDAVTMLFQPEWVAQPLASTAWIADRYLVLSHEFAHLASQLDGNTLILGDSPSEAILATFDLVQQILRDKSHGEVLVQVVVPVEEAGAVSAGVTGLLKTAQLENPKLVPQILALDAPSIALIEENRGARDRQIRYVNGQRQVAQWTELPSAAETRPWRDGGVYVISGGAGGLGLLFAREIASQVRDAKLILIGRSPGDLHSFEIEGTEYHQADVADRGAVIRLIEDVRARHGNVHGVLHSAGVIRDAFLVKKDRAEVEAVLAPKVAGLLNLDEATRDCALDFFAVFSSLSGATGNAGQADYAAANAFLDGYAQSRNRTRRTLSIDWPLWRDGGMRVDAATLERIRSSMGLAALETGEGMRAFYRALASGQAQIAVVAGDPVRARALLSSRSAMAASHQPDPQESQQSPELRLAVTALLQRRVAEALKLDVGLVETEVGLERYGIDSVLVMKLTNDLERDLGSLPKTLFFEYQTLDALAGHLVRTRADRLAQLLDVRTEVRTTSVSKNEAVERRQRKRFASPANRQPVTANHDIAIIGLSGRYPQAANVAAFWENLKSGRDSITEIPADRWDFRRYFDEEKGKPGKSYSKWGGFIDGVDRFDPLFFNISPREAALMDPQERLFLQCAFEAIEDAGYTRDALARHDALGLEGNVGVFVGVMYEEYQLFGAQAQTQGRNFALPGNPSFIANRVSYFCNFHGPSIALDTMCSSSLTALHLACQSLQRGGCEVAIAGGVNVSIHPNKYLGLSQGQFVSGEGRCESFGEGGDGYVPGEGVGAVLLKPLARAIADGDRIYGVVKATAINHGGRTNGFSVPNPNAQANVIANALKSSGVPARAISYIEAHGTGTKLGDPIEIAGLSRAFGEFTQDKQFCAIGSAKSNIGHCESAAGIAGLTKVLLQMQHGMLAPSLHAETLNPHIDFENSPFVVQRELGEWMRPVLDGREYPRIAGLSSFGAGGSNAHVVIEEYVDHAGRASAHPARADAGPWVIVLSAKTEEQLLDLVRNLLAAVEPLADADLADVAYTLQIGREAMDHRLGLTATSIGELATKLRAVADGERSVDGVHRGEVKRNKEALSVFNADEELQEAIGKWIERGKYAKLLSVWVKGLPLDWSRLYGAQKPRRIALPTYPFARDRYWIDVPTTPVSAEVEPATRFVEKQWKLDPLVLSVAIPRRAIIVASDETRALAQQLVQRIPGSRILDSTSDLDCEAWIDLSSSNDPNDRIEWIAPLQQWLERGPRHNRIALGITRGLESGATLAGATRAGLFRMLQSEYAAVTSRHVDFDAIDGEAIIAELSADTDAIEVSYRNGLRYSASLAEVDVPNGTTETFDGVLWITGGTRGIGFACAQHFARRHGARRVVLHGREALPPREQWPEALRGDDSVAAKVRAILGLEADGVEVRVTSVPLTDERALRAEVADVERTWGAVGGLLHCAGLMDFDTPAFIRKNSRSIENVFAPKVAGLDNVLRCFAAQPLRFVVLFSSVSSVIPALAAGQSDYAMANAYMDYVAIANRSSLPIVSVQWPNWKESGLGEVKGGAYGQTGLLSHTDAEGLAMLDRVIAARTRGVLMPAVVNPELWNPAKLMRRVSLPVAPRVEHVERDARATREWLMQLVGEQLQLDLARLDAETPLQDYGVDSVMLAQILASVSRRVGEKLDPSILFEYPTIESFAVWLDARYTVKVESHSASKGSEPRTVVKGVTTASDIAVVGMACRFPGAPSLDAYWNLLAEGRSAIRPLPEQRFGKGHGRYAGLLENITEFDPAFFQIPESTAAAMDPQALLVLETTLEACSHAGYPLSEIKGMPIGVYLGARGQHRPDETTLFDARDPIAAVGQNYLAANVSRFFDLRGPSLVVDTACSSALVALNLATHALTGGDIAAAFVGGVSLLDGEAALRIFEQRGLLHSGAEFHIFDSRARGTILGEGVGMVMLKTLDRAQRDGDKILAVIKGVAINNDGRTAGPTSPNVQARKDVMNAALARSGKRAEEISYVDVNGSGSEVTDLLELKAIEAVYRASNDTPCLLGSMKPNIGHPLCAEGIASLIKVVLMLHHRQWVPFLSAEEPMTHYDLASSPFRFSRALAPWNDAPRVAAINCFADGGTNAHVILEAWEAEQGQRFPITPATLHRIPIRAQSEPLPAVAASFWKRPVIVR